MRLSVCSCLHSNKIRLSVLFNAILLLLAIAQNSFAQTPPASPVITSFSPDPVCQGYPVTIKGTDFVAGQTKVYFGQYPATNIQVPDPNTIIVIVPDVAVTAPIHVETPGGNTQTSTSINITPAPRPLLTDKRGFTNCSPTASYEITVTNASTVNGTGNNYTIDWGDGTSTFSQMDWPANTTTTHIYTRQGYFTITLTIAPQNGCTRKVTYQFYNGQNPLASFTTTNPTTGLCAPADVEFQIGNWFNNTPGTRYEIDFGDGTPFAVLPHPLNAGNTVHRLSHQYVSSSCPRTDYTATLYVINGCFTTKYTLNQIIIRKKPQANFSFSPTTPCINANVCFNNLTINGSSGNNCETFTDFTWDFGDGGTSTAENPCHKYTAPGIYTVTLTASNLTCGNNLIQKQVTVNPISPDPTVTSPVSYCLNDPAAQLTATGQGLKWYDSRGNLLTGAPTPSTSTAGTFTFYVSQTLPNHCESNKVPIDVIIKPRPQAPRTAPLNLCLNQVATPLTATGSGLLWYNANAGGTGSPTAPTPSTTTAGTITYYVSQTVDGCEGQRAALTVTVNNLPVAPVVTSPIRYCQNARATALTATGNGLLWYTAATGVPGSTTAPVPPTATPGTTTYYVSQSTGCGESQRVPIDVIVTAPPAAIINYPATTFCNVTNTPNTPNPIVPVTITGTQGGTFSISPAGLKIDLTTGAIDPADATPGNYTISYKMTGTGGCPDVTATTTIRINGMPKATVAYKDLCTADPPATVTFTGTSGGTFSSTPGLSIDPATGTITPRTSTPGTYTVKYTIAASAPCPGFTTDATVTITKAPEAGIAYQPAVLCNASPNINPPVTITQTGVSGGIYSVTPAGLTINPTTGEIDPAGAPPAVYTIAYTVKGTGGCANVTATTTITITATPIASISYPAICTADALTLVNITGTRGGVFSSTSGLTIDPATGTITPGTSTPGTYTVTYKIAANPPCKEFETTTTVTVTKAATATIAYQPAILCNTANTPSTPNLPVAVTFTGTTGGSYIIVPANGLPIDPATGQINPAGAIPGVYTIGYTVTGTGGCANFNTTTTVTVIAAPTATIRYPASPYCNTLNTPQPVSLTGTSGGSFTAPAGLAINANTGAINPSASTPGTYTVTYKITANPPCNEFETTTTVTITQAPTATIAYQPAIVCNMPNTPANPNPPVAVTHTGTIGGTYAITPATGLPIDPATGQINPAGAIPGVYTVGYTVTGTGGCADYNTTTTVTVMDAPVAAISYPASPYCNAINTPQPVSLTGTGGGAFTAPAGLTINAATGAINPATSTPGSYTVTYTISPSLPCPGFQITTTVEITAKPVLTFPVANQSICSGETATYLPASTIANTTYTWSLTAPLPANMNGLTAGSLTGPNPVLSLSYTNTGTTSQTLTVRVIPTNPVKNPCAGTPFDLTLVVKPVTPAPAAITVDRCMGTTPAPLSFTPLPGTTINWYDAAQQPLSTAPVINTTQATQYIYYASQTNSYGCESPRSQIRAVVHPTAKIVATAFKHPSACGIPSGSITLTLRDLNNGALPNTPVTVHFKRLQVARTFSGITNAAGEVTLSLTAGTYTDFYVETNGPCASQQIPDVFTLKDPTPPAAPVTGYNPPLCTGMPLTLTALSATSGQAGNIAYVWAGPAFGPLPDTIRNTVVTFPSVKLADAGTYAVYAIQNNCISQATSLEVKVQQAPSKPVISTRTPLCVGDNLSLQAFSAIPGNGTLQYLWKGPGAGLPTNTPQVQINKVRIEDGGIYTVTVTSPQTGCSVSTDTLIQVGGYPVVQFAEQTLNLPTGYKMTLSPVITNATSPNIMPIRNYTWTPAKDIECKDANCASVITTVKNDICYTVKVTNIYGCSSSDQICIKTLCQNSQVFIPNAFAPNGNVPENRIFMVRSTGISTVKSFRVFNRWGKIVFERTNFPPNSTEHGWNGLVNGKPADTGVYVYTVEVICENGIPYTYKGNVTLF
ncbi:gliding motility-associated C-terminal domain-containing protein [Chitinophaga pendula]|uniref:Ig-like domain-containing protein n=1 Tax=Chitinophaga TaxID=79328 RepID=UPI000BAEF0AA|nr:MULTISPECIES: PKD domain-containing protein [Chitinophaga]ASZ12627.1 hypothetical protein CK934_17530 [Chitinophaga sp. MD30]UCJ09763.1 gliding motility-associated C-terminal domain-containing protein [Chitinophaga pendula]